MLWVSFNIKSLFNQDYKDRKCADNKNPCSAHIVPVKLYKRICTLAIPLSDYLPCTGKRGMKNRELLNQNSFFECNSLCKII